MNNKFCIITCIFTVFACSQKIAAFSSSSGAFPTTLGSAHYVDTCKNDPFAHAFKTCTCADTGNTGTCRRDYFKNESHCACSNDECENNHENIGKTCQCSQANSFGTCTSNQEGSGTYCNCTNTKRSFNEAEFASGHEPSMDAKRATLNKSYDINIYSTNIDAPIYNIPLQRSLAPITECITWWFAAAPFFKSTSIQRVDQHTIDNFESGVMFNAGVYSAVYLHALLSVAGCKTKHAVGQAKPEDLHSAPCDVLVGFGAQTDNDEWYKLNGELFFAACAERVNNHKELTEMFSLGTGFQGTADFCLAEYDASKYELSSLARVTYFVPKTNDFEDDKTRQYIGNITYSAGTFLDLFLSFKQYYGNDFQHQIDIGYNPTIHVQQASLKPAIADKNSEFNCNKEDIKTLRNTVFGTYAYNWNVEDVVMNVTVGGTATIIPSAKTYGTLFAAYSVGF